ncbi:MAG: PAS domain-containing protein [Bacteroidales bacterium]|nr:PAS domain-containing protein [Bacteroidales bacterium]
MPAKDEGPFLNEERKLLIAFSEQLGKYLERKQYEKAIRESENNLRTTLNSIGDAVIAADITGRIIRFNKVAEKLTGWSIEEAQNQPLEKVFHIVNAQSGKKVDNPVEKVLREGKGVALANHTKLISRNNTEYHIADSAAPIKDDQNVITGVVLVFRDMTEEYLIQQKLKHSYELLRYVVENTNSAVAIHDNELRYIYVSQRYLNDYKVKDKNVIGKHHYEVFPDLPQKWRDVHQRALKGEVVSADRDYYPRDDGTVEWTRWECRPWYQANGSIGGIIVYTEVITDQVKAEEQLKEKIEELEKFNKLMVGRENKMIELKREVNQLLKESGRTAKYSTPDKKENED